MSTDILSIDIETTGLDSTIHEIISIGVVHACIKKDDTGKWIWEEKNKFYSLVKPVFTNNIDKEAMKVNLLGKKELDKAPSSHVVRSDFIEWWEESLGGKEFIVLGQNFGGFDKQFLTKFFGRFYDQMFGYHSIDTWTIGFFLQNLGLIPESTNLSLSTLSTHFGEERLAHSALADAMSALTVYVGGLNLC